jgi:hypothetical protein
MTAAEQTGSQAPASDKLAGYDDDDRRRIIEIASRLVEAQIVMGQIPETDEAIRAAMPQAIQDAKQTVNAMWEYLAG